MHLHSFIRTSLLGLSIAFSPVAAQAIELNSTLPDDQKQSISYDLTTLDKMVPSTDADTDDAAAKMELTGGGVNSFSLRSWLEERVHYIVPQDWNYRSAIKNTKVGVHYPKADELPTIEKPTQSAQNGTGEPIKGKPVVIMSNIGSTFYRESKESSTLLTLKMDAHHTETLLSPRIGIIKVGQGLFSENFRINKTNPDTPANSVARLAIFFHESRHSDGNGKSLGFIHAVCPSGTYEGYSACDRNRNGPYSIEAALLKVMIKQCIDCSVADKEVLRTMMMNSASRVLDPDTNFDATPELLSE